MTTASQAIDEESLARDMGMAPEALRDWVKGVIAAPARQRLSWTDVAAPRADAGLKARLEVYRQRMEQVSDPGFTDGPAPADRLAALREELKRRGIDAFLVPRTDEYQNEYVPARAERLLWLTGFSGSAGMAVAGVGKSGIFVDGRYTLQVQGQVHVHLFEPHHLIEDPPERWIAEHFPAGARIGYDPWLTTEAQLRKWEAAATGKSISYVALDSNPVDAVWRNQPSAPLGVILPHGVEHAGEDSAAKRARIADAVAKAGADCAVLTAVDSIAWLLNLRGGDVGHSPLPLSYAVLSADGTADWFVDERKLAPDVHVHLGNAVRVHAMAGFIPYLAAQAGAGRTVLVDPSTAPLAVLNTLSGAQGRLVRGTDPVALPKACKNATEIEGTRQAHLRDAVALTRFLHWVKTEAPKGGITEITASDRLESFRAEDPALKDLSFDSISGAGPNGAVIHYRATPRTDRELKPGELYLIDSGGQYPDGTTDVTRTLAIGAPNEEMRDRFTRVLKGHIAIAMAVFPEGTTGSQLDILARQALWQVGLDYDHGTGHGVGSYLNVHEGPQRISKAANTTALWPGMIISNEPGYYKTGFYGIRIENLVVVQSHPMPLGGERPLFGFETVTLAPIDRDLVATELLTQGERDWLNAYHARVHAALGPKLDADCRAWLDAVTAPI